MVEDGAPHMPANRTDGDDFERAWCAHCLGVGQGDEWEDEFGDLIEVKCQILDDAFCGLQPPEWKYHNGRPVCTAFREDPDNKARCLRTLEMFPLDVCGPS